MSRVGKNPVTLPKGVSVSVAGGQMEIKGPKGTVKRPLPSTLKLVVREGSAAVEIGAGADSLAQKALWGTSRALLANAVKGVSQGYAQTLKLEGTGYKAEVKGQTLNLSLGLSHAVTYVLPKSIAAKVPQESKGTILQLEGYDKIELGQAVANLQRFRMPEPYQGKGVQREGQKIRRKAGKAGKGAK